MVLQGFFQGSIGFFCCSSGVRTGNSGPLEKFSGQGGFRIWGLGFKSYDLMVCRFDIRQGVLSLQKVWEHPKVCTVPRFMSIALCDHPLNRRRKGEHVSICRT